VIRVLSFAWFFVNPDLAILDDARSRQSTFFDLRVQPDFPESASRPRHSADLSPPPLDRLGDHGDMYAVGFQPPATRIVHSVAVAAMLATMLCRWIALSSARAQRSPGPPSCPNLDPTARYSTRTTAPPPGSRYSSGTGILLPLRGSLATLSTSAESRPAALMIQVFPCVLRTVPARSSSRCGLALAAAIGRRTRIRAGNTELARLMQAACSLHHSSGLRSEYAGHALHETHGRNPTRRRDIQTE